MPFLPKKNNSRHCGYFFTPFHQKIFCHLPHYCNLVVEFNGLVSKGVGLSAGPFALIIPPDQIRYNNNHAPTTIQPLQMHCEHRDQCIEKFYICMLHFFRTIFQTSILSHSSFKMCFLMITNRYL